MSHHPASLLRALFVSASALALAACGSSYGNPGGSFGFSACDPQTQVQIASPTQGQTGVSTNIGQVIIVANGNNNVLYQTYQGWYLSLTDNLGATYPGSSLSLVPFTSGPHPYPSDFYYSSSIGTLLAGRTYNVFLIQSNTGCQPLIVGSFST